MALIIYAPNINRGGGLVLLIELLSSLPENVECHLMLDKRVKNSIQFSTNRNIVWITPNPISRLWGEYYLKKNVSSKDLVLFFHGIPPLFKCKSFNVVFIQNKFLITKFIVYGGIYQSLRIIFERLLLRVGLSNVDVFIVQTNSMKELLEKYLNSLIFSVKNVKPRIQISSFHNANIKDHEYRNSKKYDFIYISSGELHKNHRNLLKAWKLLSKEGAYPSLGLTLSGGEKILQEVSKCRSQYNLQISNLGTIAHSEISDLLISSRALIFPSLHESLGLPLIEASLLSVPILAGELDYVRDVCMPTETFNPDSPISIARAVKRFLNHPENLLKQISANEFVCNLLTMENCKSKHDY